MTTSLNSYDKVPAAIRELPQWVVYKLEPRHDGKMAKIPHNPRTGKKASVNNSATWGTFEEAVAHANKYDGIGFVFTESDSFTGVDFDGVLNTDTGEIAPWANNLIKKFDSYCEISPSGKGVHTLVQATLPGVKGCHPSWDHLRRYIPEIGPSQGLEIYDRKRYFAVTGNIFNGFPRGIEPRQHALDDLLSLLELDSPSQNRSVGIDSIVQKMIEDRHLGKKIERVWNAGWRGLYSSQSEADLFLCGQLVKATNGDAVLVDSLFRRSKLIRDKWDEKHGQWTYGERTVNTAINGWKNGGQKGKVEAKPLKDTKTRKSPKRERLNDLVERVATSTEPIPKVEIEIEAIALGVSKTTLNRALTERGLRSKKGGFGRGKGWVICGNDPSIETIKEMVSMVTPSIETIKNLDGENGKMGIFPQRLHEDESLHRVWGTGCGESLVQLLEFLQSTESRIVDRGEGGVSIRFPDGFRDAHKALVGLGLLAGLPGLTPNDRDHLKALGLLVKEEPVQLFPARDFYQRLDSLEQSLGGDTQRQIPQRKVG